MSFHLVPHMPRLFAMDAKFLACKEKVSNFNYDFLFILLLILLLLATKMSNKNANNVKFSLIFVSGKNAILSHELYACLDCD